MSTALESLTRSSRQLHSFRRPEWEIIVVGQNQLLAPRGEPELHLVTYLVAPCVYQIGMNGVVSPNPAWINPEEVEDKVEKEVVSDNQLELPLFKEGRGTTSKDFMAQLNWQTGLLKES